MLAKNTEVARSLSRCILEREGCDKIYLARVKGRFPVNLVERESWEFRCTLDDGGDDIILPPCRHGLYSEMSMKQWKGDVRVALKSKNNTNRTSDDSTAALGYWFSDQHGKVMPNVSWHEISTRATNTSAEEILNMVKNEGNTNQSKHQTNNTPDKSIYWLNFACPCRVSSHKDGICEAGEFIHLTNDKDRKGIKPAQTSFALLTYDASSDTSVVLAKPITGRTHQIRLHLQQLGHPIANDDCYGGEMWYSDEESRDASQKAKEWLNELDNTSSSSTLSKIPATDSEIQQMLTNDAKGDDESTLDFIERTCVWCARCKGAASSDNNTSTKMELHEAVMNRTLIEYFVESQGIWLHAWQYSMKMEGSNDVFGGKRMTYRTQLPSWACISTLTDSKR